LTDLLSDSMIAKMPDQAAKRAAAFEMALRQSANPQPARPAPQPAAKAQRGGYASLLVPTLEEAESTVALTRKNDDWQMQTRPYDRKTMEPLPTAAALVRPEKPREKPRAERVRRLGETSELSAGVEAFCRGPGIDPSNL